MNKDEFTQRRNCELENSVASDCIVKKVMLPELVTELDGYKSVVAYGGIE